MFNPVISDASYSVGVGYQTFRNTIFKAKVALAAVKGARRRNALAGHFAIHPPPIVQRKQRLVTGASDLFPGGGTRDDATRQVPEDVARYPEQYFFGVLPAWALFVRHADGIRLRNVKLDCHAADARPPVFLEDVGRWDAQGVLINGRPTTVAAPLQQPQK